MKGEVTSGEQEAKDGAVGKTPNIEHRTSKRVSRYRLSGFSSLLPALRSRPKKSKANFIAACEIVIEFVF